MVESARASADRPSLAFLAFAWAGGVLFAVSLAVFLYVYEVTYGVSTIGPIGPPVAIDVALFTIFALHHSVMARARAKRWLLTRVPAWLERSVFTWVASGLFLLVCLAWRPVPGLVYSLEGPWRLAALAIQTTGLAFAIAASRALDVLDLAGVRAVLDARRGSAPAHVPLRMNGLFRVVRHPLYLAWALFVFGTPDLTGTRAAFAAVSTLYLMLAIPLEERSLLRAFGDAYAQYQRQTQFRMIPWIW